MITFVHDSQKFCVIDRKTKEIMDINWLENQTLCCTGLQWAPSFHPMEMSIVFVRGINGVHMLNTQTWHISTLIYMSDGSAKFPDLQLLDVAEGEDHSLVVLTMDKQDKLLVKRTYSHMLKFCLQTASIRSSCFKAEAIKKRLE